MADTNMVTARIGNKDYETHISTGVHTLLADEPESLGGQDVGPDAGDFLRMSLATCTAITLRMYANRKNYSIDEIRVYVSSAIIDKTYTLTRIIEMDGEIDETIRARMVQIANACPLHKTLTNPIEIKTELR